MNLYNKKEFNKLCLKIRNCDKYKEWKQLVLDRDKETLKNLQVHHKKPFSEIILKNNITTVEDAEKCNELWDIGNGITITKGEHYVLSLIERSKYHTKGFFVAMKLLLKSKKAKVYKERNL